jgi:membrane-bound lytic murein transglycosylase MltF
MPTAAAADKPFGCVIKKIWSGWLQLKNRIKWSRVAGPFHSEDIKETKQLIGSQSLLVMERTCLDPANYGLKGVGVDLKLYTKSTNLNEMAPALLSGEAQLTLLDVPDAVLDLRKWAGQIKVLGPVSEPQILAAAFPKDAVKLRDAFNAYLRKIKADGTYDRLVDKYYPGIRRFFPDFFEKKA